MPVNLIAACVLGAVLGYITHFLIRKDANPGIKDLSIIIADVLGGGVFGVIGGGDATSWYLIGLGIGFFLYWAALMLGREGRHVNYFVGGERHLTLFPFL